MSGLSRSRVVFNPDDKGIYLPLDLWKSLHANGRLKGPQGGNVLGFGNVGRKLSNSEFIVLEFVGRHYGPSIRGAREGHSCGS
jgi:hypothetical protein